jgi:hypothetical protein
MKYVTVNVVHETNECHLFSYNEHWRHRRKARIFYFNSKPLSGRAIEKETEMGVISFTLQPPSVNRRLVRRTLFFYTTSLINHSMIATAVMYASNELQF